MLLADREAIDYQIAVVSLRRGIADGLRLEGLGALFRSEDKPADWRARRSVRARNAELERFTRSIRGACQSWLVEAIYPRSVAERISGPDTWTYAAQITTEGALSPQWKPRNYIVRTEKALERVQSRIGSGSFEPSRLSFLELRTAQAELSRTAGLEVGVDAPSVPDIAQFRAQLLDLAEMALAGCRSEAPDSVVTRFSTAVTSARRAYAIADDTTTGTVSSDADWTTTRSADEVRARLNAYLSPENTALVLRDGIAARADATVEFATLALAVYSSVNSEHVTVSTSAAKSLVSRAHDCSVAIARSRAMELAHNPFALGLLEEIDRRAVRRARLGRLPPDVEEVLNERPSSEPGTQIWDRAAGLIAMHGDTFDDVGRPTEPLGHVGRFSFDQTVTAARDARTALDLTSNEKPSTSPFGEQVVSSRTGTTAVLPGP